MIELDSSNLYENGKKYLQLVDELERNIDYIFNRMDGMPDVTLEWQGNSVKKFLNNAHKDKKQFKDFITTLRSYGNSLLSQSEKIELCAKRVKL